MMHYVFTPAAPAYYMPRRAFCPTRDQCGVSQCASPLFVMAMLLILPTVLRLFLGLGVLALTLMANLVPIFLMGLATHSFVNAMRDDGSDHTCRPWFAEATTCADKAAGTTKPAGDKTEERKQMKSEKIKECSIVHNISSEPSVQVTEDKITVVLAVPGVRSEDLEVTVLDDNVLCVTGATSNENMKYTVNKNIQLPAVDVETMTATHEDGVLSVEVQRKVRRVTVAVATSSAEVKATKTSANGRSPSMKKKEDDWDMMCNAAAD